MRRLKQTGVQFRPCRVSNSYSYLENADIFVLPLLEEGSGSLSLLEALQTGVASVASNIDDIPEDVVDGETALLVSLGQTRRARRRHRTIPWQLDICRRIFEMRFNAALRQTYAELCLLPRVNRKL